MSLPTEFHSTLSRTYHTLWISVRQPITEVKAEWNVATDVWEIEPIDLFKTYLTDTAMLISELTRFDSFYIFFHGTPRVYTM